MNNRDRILGGLWGSIVGDAYGVPREFRSREDVKKNPVHEMEGHGTWNQPIGSWSDDGSLLLCTVDSLVEHEFDIEDMGRKFCAWRSHGIYTSHGHSFDIGIATSSALARIRSGVPAADAGGDREFDNGNGSIMRILPVALRFRHFNREKLFDRICQASAITHAHQISKLACVFHGALVCNLMDGLDAMAAWAEACGEFESRYKDSDLKPFSRMLDLEFFNLPESQIRSGGYVIDTLEASAWCLLNSKSFSECVRMGMLLGGDTDTTCCVAGGLAGILYGYEAIPQAWLGVLPRQALLRALFEKFVALSVPTSAMAAPQMSQDAPPAVPEGEPSYGGPIPTVQDLGLV